MELMLLNVKKISMSPQELVDYTVNVANAAAFAVVQAYEREGEYFSKAEVMDILKIKRAEMDRIINNNILTPLPRSSKDEKMRFPAAQVMTYRRQRNRGDDVKEHGSKD